MRSRLQGFQALTTSMQHARFGGFFYAWTSGYNGTILI